MKKSILLLLFLISIFVRGNNKDTLFLSSKITNVTVFFDGAQITRETSINLEKGENLLCFNKLPNELIPNSVQVNSMQNGEILFVKQEHKASKEKKSEKKKIENEIKTHKRKIEELNNKIKVYETEEKILLTNSNFNKEGGASIEDIKKVAVFYRAKLNEINQNKLELSFQIDSLKDYLKKLYVKLNKTNLLSDKIFSNVYFLFNSEKTDKYKFKITYFVKSAGWVPSYDIRVNNLNQLLNLVYNANIFQTTGEDWEEINLTLSSNTPSVNNNKPELKPWYINRQHKTYKQETYKKSGTLKGKVYENSGKPIPFANITLTKDNKTIISNFSDFDGYYVAKPIPAGIYDVEVSCIGFNTVQIRNVKINSNRITFLDIKLTPQASVLREVEVRDYRVPIISKDQTESKGTMPGRSEESLASTIGGVSSENEIYKTIGSSSGKTVYFTDGYKMKNINGFESKNNINNVKYEIKTPYTILSDGKDYNIRIQKTKIPVEYYYYSAPKLDKDVFVIANIINWAKLNLLSGKINVYYKGTYVGESYINSNNTKDTLSISLNREKNITVERTMLKEKSDKQFIGKNIKEKINWHFVVKNNKTENVKLILEDQIPIPENKSIEISNIDYANGKLNKKTGKITWELNLLPGDKKEFDLIYSIKYPNYMNITIE